MKKRIILIVSVIAVLIFALAGCSGKLKNTTVSETQAVWDSTANKQAQDVITILNFNIAELVVVEKAEFSIDREFKDGKVTIDISLNELKMRFNNDARGLFNIAIGQIENINLSFDDIKGIVSNFKAFNCHLVLSENNSKVDYLVNFQTDYKPEVFNQNKEGSTAIDNNTESIKLTLDLLLSHYTTLFEPLETGAQLKATNINKIIKSATTQEERNTIREIFGVDYTRLLNEKLVVNNSNNKCFISKNFIKKMNISLSDIQFMYNKTQLIDVIGNAIKKLSPNNANLAETAKKLLNSYVKELTKNESCIEIGNINITSNYQLN